MISLADVLADIASERTLPFSFWGLGAEGQTVVPETPLQAWPESIAVSMSVEYADKQILGGSHALANWSSSSGRAITFSFKLSRDTQVWEDLPGLIRPFVADPKGTPDNADIKQIIDRMLTMVLPDYTSENNGAETIAQPPAVAMIRAPGLGWSLNLDDRDVLVGTIRSLNYNYKSTFKNGEPRLVTVDMTVNECVQRAGRGVEFVGRSALIAASPRYYNPR